MKRTLFILTILFTGILAKAQPVFQSGIEYNDYIVAEQTKVGELIIKLSNNMDAEETVVRSNFSALLTQAKLSLENVKKLGAYNNNTELRDASLALFVFYVDIIDKEYRSMIDLLLKPDFTTDDLNKINEYLTSITERELSLDNAFATAQQNFATQNGFDLIENEFQDEVDQLGE